MEKEETRKYSQNVKELHEISKLLLSGQSKPESFDVRVERRRGTGLAPWYNQLGDLVTDNKKG